MSIQGKDRQDLRRAVELLENPSFISRIIDVIGKPVEKVMDSLPTTVSGKIQDAVQATLNKLLVFAVKTMGEGFQGRASTLTHKIASGLSGAIGGAFGLPALAVELPVSTSIILRSIADIARSEGEDIAALEARLACLEVFALGGRSGADDMAETGYFAVRAALAKAVSDAAKHIATKGLTEKSAPPIEKSAPPIARFITQISSRFGAVVSEKMAVQAVPVIGALGGATINLLFVDHFQDAARGHFIVRRLEREFGEETVQREYMKILSQSRT
ncbi:MAG: EcsC family protein [Deltaproteobacteria bacterium]|nr:EcsC family protein [Deltaproteobacteria bacterium]